MPSSALSCGALAAWTAAAVALQVGGVALFVLGFFPVKPTLPGVSGLESFKDPRCNESIPDQGRELPPGQLRSLYEDLSELSPKYDRLIMMVIDGLPAEFVLGRGNMPPTKHMMDAMPYTQFLLSNKHAIGYHAKAAPPTVTMPRLKAIVSGAVGGFLDVVFNFNTQAFLDDNLLEQFYRIGWRIVMHGDETWIKLFPRFFHRQDGVSSFYVKDTVEVDYNVSRHLDSELAADDWNLLILHYLGLDHAGHIGGRRSDLMVSKLNEMDGVIEKICTSFLNGKSDAKHTLLLVTSDHGMTDEGNHGGSSLEETDSLALFVDLDGQTFHRTSVNQKLASQVDIAPTLALLIGVPIPKNNIGVLLRETFDSLTDGQLLRALELNSWQLLRLLQSQLPGFLCEGDFPKELQHKSSIFGTYDDGAVEKLCLLYLKAIDFHAAWKKPSASNTTFVNTTNFTTVVKAYHEFLRTASKWLSNRATNKPINLLLVGTLMIIASSCSILKLLFYLIKEVELISKKSTDRERICYLPVDLDEAYIILGVLLHLVSLGSSSMIEEEQYTWHFLASTSYLIFLFVKIQTIFTMQQPKETSIIKVENKRKSKHSVFSAFLSKMYPHWSFPSILMVLICGRILRGWHQGGVNWLHHPDISKWLERSGSSIIVILQVASVLLIIFIGTFTIYFLESVNSSAVMVLICNFLSGLLILLNILRPIETGIVGVTIGDHLIPQMFYFILLVTTFSTLASPWFLRFHHKGHLTDETNSEYMFVEHVRDCTYLIGCSFTIMWCLLQLLLQHPLDAMPVLLLLLQILASMIYFMADNGSVHKQWVKVAAIYFLSMAGHFALGNSNSIATIDVAGAFTGLSSHSTTLAGILMFCITYASPLLFQISGIMCLPMESLQFSSTPHKSELSRGLLTTIGLPCLVPLALNSFSLTAFTIILLLMRNHLFVWSVFSPKYLYICAATASIYIGVLITATSVTFVFMVLFWRLHRTNSQT